MVAKIAAANSRPMSDQDFIGKILSGANAADLPVIEPTTS